MDDHTPLAQPDNPVSTQITGTPFTPPEDTPFSSPPPDPVTSLARERFSIPHLYPIQRYAIANILDSIHQIVVLPTGSGKSLCFHLPALLLPGVTLIILPLLSLMKDQVRRLSEVNMTSCAIKGGQSDTERNTYVREIIGGKTKVIFITPESLESPKLDSFFNQVDISHLVIDEAHCVTEWGDTFRPAYLNIGAFIKKWKPAVVSAFTATASPPVTAKIKEALFGGLPVSSLIENPDRQNIHYSVIPVLSKSRAVTSLLESAERPVIVYTRSRKHAEFYAHLARERLATNDVFFYHAGLNSDERKAVEEWFMPSRDGILFATSAFGMGVDKPDVRTIIHTSIPFSVEGYLQESGRAGRDRKASKGILLFSHDDNSFAHKLDHTIRRARFLSLLSYAHTHNVCRRKTLLSLLDYELTYPCPGCDCCDKTVVKEKEGEAMLMEYVARNKRRFTKRELVQILHGKQTYDVVKKDLDRFGGFGLLASWHKEDIEEAVDLLMEAGKLRIPVKGFWKYKVTSGSFARGAVKK